ncbi:MAG: hypothetical protein CME06_18370 [Gemmatimonadetes bacterium]|nr:hypothetical protein [Gemmatimonadota bacterium]
MDSPDKSKAQLLEELAASRREIAALRRRFATASQDRERFTGFFSTISEYCYMVSPEGLIIDANRAALEALNYEHDELVGKPLALIYAPESKEEMKSAFATWKRTGIVRDTELVIQTREGKRLTVILNVTAVHDQDGSLLHSISVQHDITERRRREDDQRRMDTVIQQTQRLEGLGVLAGGIAHDFNNILMGIMGHAELALVNLSPLSPAREDLAKIMVASKRAAELCGQMLAYAGKGRIEQQDIFLGDLIEETLHMLETCISKKAILNLNLAKELPGMHGDPSQIRQILMNLVVNASEAIGERSGVITISTGAMESSNEHLPGGHIIVLGEPGTYVYVEVSDTGCGMDKKTVERIFDPFFTTKFTGRGLGLSAIMGIVTAHKGAFRVYSEVGKGTAFKVLFPMIEVAEERHPDGVVGGAWRGAGTVMLVDDEETVRTVSSKQLRQLGLEVLTADDGRQAVEIYRERRADIALVLLDLTMPHMNGEEAYRELRRINPDVRVILASGYSENDIEARFAGKGMAGCLQKPYTLIALRSLLSRLLPAAKPLGVSEGDADHNKAIDSDKE